MQSHSDSRKSRGLQTAEQFDAAIASFAFGQTATGSTEELLELRTCRNAAIPPISRLPDDILAEAFVFVAHDCRHRRVRRWGSFRWIIVSHICRHWRIVALDHASLWAHQIRLLSTQDCWQTFLRRAKGSPLFISAHAYEIYQGHEANREELDPTIFHTIQPHAPHFRSLCLDVSAKLLSALAHSPTLDAPILTSLYIRFWRRARSDTTPDNLWFLSIAPLHSLTDLKLMYAPSPLLCTLLRATLTRLTVIESEVSVAKWIEILALTPSLELLHLSESVGLGPEPLPAPSTAVELPQLRKLVLEEESWNQDAELIFTHLLTHLAIRAGCSILLMEVDSCQYCRLFAALTPKIPRAPLDTHMMPPLTACTVHVGPQSFAVGLWECPEDVVRCLSSTVCEPEGSALWHDILPDNSPYFVVNLKCATDDPMQDILSACLRFLPLAGATSLYLLGATDWLFPSEDLCAHEVLSAFAHITHLHFTYKAPTGLLRHLAHPAAPSNTLHAPGIYPTLPSLQSLTLHLECAHDHGAHCQRLSQAVALREDVEAMLDARREMGLPLASLCFDEVKEEEITVLAEMAATRKEIAWTVAKDPHWHLVQCDSMCVEVG